MDRREFFGAAGVSFLGAVASSVAAPVGPRTLLLPVLKFGGMIGHADAPVIPAAVVLDAARRLGEVPVRCYPSASAAEYGRAILGTMGRGWMWALYDPGVPFDVRDAFTDESADRLCLRPAVSGPVDYSGPAPVLTRIDEVPYLYLDRLSRVFWADEDPGPR